MCGDIPADCYAVEVVLHFDAGQENVIVQLNRVIEHLVEIRINEYTIHEPGPGSLWRLDFGPWLKEFQTTNALGSGFCHSITDEIITHVNYQRPRVFTINNKGHLTTLGARITSVSTTGVQDAQFTSATYFLTLVCKEPRWDPRVFIEEDKLIPQNVNRQFAGRREFP